MVVRKKYLLISIMIFFWSSALSFTGVPAGTLTSIDKLVLYLLHSFVLASLYCAFICLVPCVIIRSLRWRRQRPSNAGEAQHEISPLMVSVVLLLMTIAFQFPVREHVSQLILIFLVLFLFSWSWLRSKSERISALITIGLMLIIIVVLINDCPFRIIEVHSQISGGTEQGLRTADRPDILLVSIDTLRADHLGCYGHPTIKTPQIDRLARSSRLYTDVVSPQALTGPAHATLLTGRYPDELGCFSNGDPIVNDQPNSAVSLAAKGYESIAVVSGYPLKHEFFNLSDSFSVYDDVFSPWWFPHDMVFSSPLVRLLADRGLIYDRRYLFERRGKQANERVRSLTKRVTSPLFLFVHYYEPHGPYEPPPPFDRMYFEGDVERRDEAWPLGITFPAYQRLRGIASLDYPRSQYMGEASYTDKLLGQLLSTSLAARNERERLVIITADHGESLGEHDYYFDHGQNCHTPSIHVPLLVHGPPDSAPGIDVRPLSLTAIDGIVRGEAGVGRPVARSADVDSGNQTYDCPCSCPQPPIFLQATTNMLQHGRDRSTLELIVLIRGVKCGDLLFFKESERETVKLLDRVRDSSETVDISLQHPEVTHCLQVLLDARVSEYGLDEKRHSLDLRHDQQRALKALGYIE